MRQVENDKEDGAHQQQGGEQAQIKQGRRRKRHQRQEGTHGGDVTHHQRGKDFLQGPFSVRLVRRMGNQVQGIVDGYAQDNACNANDNDGHVVPEQRKPAQRKQQSPAHREEDEEDVAQAVEGPRQKQENKHRGEGNRQNAVFLDTSRIAHRDSRAAYDVYGNLRIVHANLLGNVLQGRQQLGIVPGFTASVWGIQHHHRPAHIRGKDIIVVQFEPLLSHRGLQAGHHRSEEVQGVVRNPASHQRRGQQKGLAVVLQRMLQIAGLCQQAVHPGHIGFCKEVRDVLVHVVRHVGNGIHVYLRGERRASFFIGQLYEGFDGFHGIVRVFRPGEEEDNLIGARNILVYGHLFPLPGAQRQEVADIFAEVQRSGQIRQDAGEHQQ